MWSHRRLGMIASVSLYLVGMATGHAEDEAKKTCAAAYESAQRLMRTGSLIEARQKLVLCGGPQCPEAMHPDCLKWLSAVEASTPTLVFQVSATQGAPPQGVLLAVDGGEAMPLDGRAVSVDPGEHEVTFTASGYRTSALHLVVSEGEKLRREAVALAPVDAVEHTAAPGRPGVAASRFTLPVIIASSAAALAAIGVAYFGIKARVDDYDLDRCQPHCTKETVDNVRREYLLTNLSLGLAVAGVTTATVLYLVQGRPAHQPATTVVGITAGPAGIGPVLAGRF
jgi:hypothetical protein